MKVMLKNLDVLLLHCIKKNEIFLRFFFQMEKNNEGTMFRVNSICASLELFTEVKDNIFTPTKNSPDLIPKLNPDSISFLISEKLGIPIDETAVEADKVWLSVLCLDSILQHNISFFPKVSVSNFVQFCDFLVNFLRKDPEYKDILYYTLYFNDLGKCLNMCEIYKSLNGHDEKNHDECLYWLVKNKPELFPYFNSLSEKSKKLILDGLLLMSDFNLGQFFQMESEVVNMLAFETMDYDTIMLRLLESAIDMFGVTGDKIPDKVILMTDSYISKFFTFVRSLDKFFNGEKDIGIFQDDYMQHVLSYSDYEYCEAILTDSKNQISLKLPHFMKNLDFAKSVIKKVMVKIYCLTGRNDPRFSEIFNAFSMLTREEMLILLTEMVNTGIVGNFILLYYLPSTFRSLNERFKNRDEQMILYLWLRIVAGLYKHAKKVGTGNGLYTNFDCSEISRRIKDQNEDIFDFERLFREK